jgi:hypothetical protein
MEDLQGAATVTSALHYRIRSCQILVTGKQQKPRGAQNEDQIWQRGQDDRRHTAAALSRCHHANRL